MSTNREQEFSLNKLERVPPCYKEVEKILKQVKACKGNLKTLLYNSRLRGPIRSRVFSLSESVLKHRYLLEKIIEDTQLLEKVPFLRKEFAGILIYQIILGKGLSGESAPVVAIKKYEEEIKEAYNIVRKDKSLHPTGLFSLPRYARVNTLVTSVSKVLEDLRNSGFQQMQYDKNTALDGYMNLVKSLQVGNFLIDFHFKDLLVFASKENLTNWHIYLQGHIFIQDKSSYIPVHVLDPKPGSTVLDSCAAPGMKTIHLASLMTNEGQLYAYERDEKRFKILQNTLESAYVNICEAGCEDFYLVNPNDPKFRSLEYILVDPSCSGSGMVNRMDSVTDTEDSKNEFRLQKLAGFQILLLKHALSFPSVKRVVYSTCSITEQENEFVVHEVLKRFENKFKLVSVMSDWPIRGSDNFKYGHLCLRAFPDKSLTNGFFVAMFERLEGKEYENSDSSNLTVNPIKSKKAKNKKKSNNLHFDGTEGYPNSYIKKADVNHSVEERLEGEEYENSENSSDLTVNAIESKKDKNKKESNNLQFDGTEEYLDSDIKMECNVNHSVEADHNANEEKKKKKHKKCHTEIQETVSVENCDGLTESCYGLTESCLEATNSSEEHTKKKKHKKKRSHSQNSEALLESFENVTEKSLESTTTNELETTEKKKHKKKRSHSQNSEALLESFENVTEKSLESTTTHELETTEKKKHKKKNHSESKELFFNENNDVTQNTSELKVENPMKKKHKKKRHHSENQDEDNEDVSKDTFDVKDNSIKKHKKKRRENLEVETDSVIENVLDFEETQIKKKHKKKCKDKKNKND